MIDRLKALGFESLDGAAPTEEVLDRLEQQLELAREAWTTEEGYGTNYYYPPFLYLTAAPNVVRLEWGSAETFDAWIEISFIDFTDRQAIGMTPLHYWSANSWPKFATYIVGCWGGIRGKIDDLMQDYDPEYRWVCLQEALYKHLDNDQGWDEAHFYQTHNWKVEERDEVLALLATHGIEPLSYSDFCKKFHDLDNAPTSADPTPAS
jgi:hypothetical protein